MPSSISSWVTLSAIPALGCPCEPNRATVVSRAERPVLPCRAFLIALHQPALPRGRMPGRGSLSVHAERRPLGPWPGSDSWRHGIDAGAVVTAHRGGRLGPNRPPHLTACGARPAGAAAPSPAPGDL